MAPIDRCLASMARLSLSPTSFSQAARPSATSIPRFLVPALLQSRQASKVREKPKMERKGYKRRDLSKAQFPQFSLCYAMRVLRANEVGHPPSSSKYDLCITLKTRRVGPMISDTIRLPHPLGTEWRIAVICPEDSEIAEAATAAGAVAVGEESIFAAVREGDVTFDRLICHESSERALQKAMLGKILGPKGLMPHRRNGTVTKNVVHAIKNSADEMGYREHVGVIRVAIGRLSFTPQQLKANIQALVGQVKSKCEELSTSVGAPKRVHEVILSSTHGSALSLNSLVRDEEKDLPMEAVTGPI
ncbi:hypothetical protein CDD83_1693 [Cordyceps sp. RAO-2017]|nr:hypothetical protein CDD83_1693 [Cordyceps sp. RAO-2017]